jgi:protoporphyrinogen oxidase
MTEANGTVILGTGMSAWGAFDRLQGEGITPTLYDKNDYLGGHTASFNTDGFIFDDGPHISFTEIDRIKDLLGEAVDGDYETPSADFDNWYHGHVVTHPAIANLHGLPADLIDQIIADFKIAAEQPVPESFGNYMDWLYASFGTTFAENFPAVYGRKYHTVDPSLMNTDWLGPRLYRPDLEELLKGAAGDTDGKQHYIDKFRYPKRNGFVEYQRKFHERSKALLGHEATAIDPVAKTITFSNGLVTGYDSLISSLPLPELIRILPDVPADVLEAASKLSCSQCVTVNIGVDRADLSPAHCRYVYDEDMASVRLTFPHMFSPSTVPDGHGSVQVEVYYSDKYKPLDHDPNDDIASVKSDLLKMGILRESDTVVVEEARLIKYANVIFDLDSIPCTEIVHGYLDEIGIERCGRYGDWGYIWSDQAYLSGEASVERMLARR